MKSWINKFSLASLAVLITWSMTSQIRAQLPGKKSAKSPSPRIEAAFRPNTKSEATKEQLAWFAQQPKHRPISSAARRSFELTPGPQMVKVSATASLYESDENARHFFALRVLDLNKKVIIPREVFIDQPANYIVGEDSVPAFVTSIPLPEGEYLVDITMHRLPPNNPAESFQNEEFVENSMSFCWPKKVVVRR